MVRGKALCHNPLSSSRSATISCASATETIEPPSRQERQEDFSPRKHEATKEINPKSEFQNPK
jgi:hypothetical protein